MVSEPLQRFIVQRQLQRLEPGRACFTVRVERRRCPPALARPRLGAGAEVLPHERLRRAPPPHRHEERHHLHAEHDAQRGGGAGCEQERPRSDWDV